MKKNTVRRTDAEHYIAANNSPINLQRPAPGRPIAMVTQEGRYLEMELGKGTILYFWGFDKVIAVVDAWKEHNGGKP